MQLTHNLAKQRYGPIPGQCFFSVHDNLCRKKNLFTDSFDFDLAMNQVEEMKFYAVKFTL